MVLTLRLCVLYGSQNKRRLLPYTTLTHWFCTAEVESVYCAVRTESFTKQSSSVFKELKTQWELRYYGNVSSVQLTGRWSGPRGGLDAMAKKKSLPQSGMELPSPSPQSANHFTDRQLARQCGILWPVTKKLSRGVAGFGSRTFLWGN